MTNEVQQSLRLRLQSLGMDLSLEHYLVMLNAYEFSSIYLDMFEISDESLEKLNGSCFEYEFGRILSLERKEDVAELKRVVKMFRELESVEVVVNE